MIEKQNYFGKYKEFEVLEYKKPGINIFEVFKDVQKGKVPQDDLLIPMFRWYSNNKLNINQMQFINKSFFYVKKSVLCRNLVLNINRNIRFIKTLPKKVEEELEFLIPYVCRYYNWSDREYQHHKHLIDLKDIVLHQELDKLYVFEKTELRKLGMKREKIKTKFEAVQKTKGFF